MDYEKKYNEAMLRADEAVQKGCLDKATFDIIFPPKESEDERIRKYILRACEETIEGGGKGLELSMDTTKKLAAYLEKQKEQNLVPCNAQCGECPCFISGMNYQKEQKPVEQSHKGIHSGSLHKEPDMRWIKEDEEERKMLSSLTDFERAIYRGFLCAGVENVSIPIIKETAKECLAQMKPVEWSEEDIERMVKKRSLLSGNTASELHFYRQGIKDTLKSLSHSWKPSKEQMNALNALNCHGDLSYVFQQNQLISLYNDLKKLM